MIYDRYEPMQDAFRSCPNSRWAMMFTQMGILQMQETRLVNRNPRGILSNNKLKFELNYALVWWAS